MGWEYVPPGQGTPNMSGGNTQYAQPIGTLAGQVGAGPTQIPPGFEGISGGGPPSINAGNTKEITLADGRRLLVDMEDGHVISQYGTAGEEFAQKQQLQSQSEASQAARQASSEAAADRRQQNDPQNDPWRSMMPRYTAPSAVQGERGALDIMDPNTGQLMSVRQPGPPPVRVVGGNLIVDPGANAAVYYAGNKGQATNVSGGPQMLNMGAQFPSAMSQAGQVASKIQRNRQQGGGVSYGGGGAGGGSAGGGNRFGNPGGAGGSGGMSQFRNMPSLQAPQRFTNPGSPSSPEEYTRADYAPEPGYINMGGYTADANGPFFNPDSYQMDLNDYHPEIDWNLGYHA